jgi:antitoxin PrlF
MAVLEEVSTITAKGQTTVPRAVRRVLGVGAGDKIAFHVEGNRVTLVAAESAHSDPVVGKFLEFVARDMGKRPEALKAISREFAARISSVVKGKKVDLDEPIVGDVDL